MIIKGHNVNAKLSEVVKSVSNNLQNADKFLGKKLDEADDLLVLKRPISSQDAKYIFDNATYVATCSQILAEDTIMNDVTLTPSDEEATDETKQIVEKINEYLLDNIDEFCNMAVDYNYSGFAAMEITTDSTKFTLKQLPSNTLDVVQVTEKRNKFYLLRQTLNGRTYYYRILGEDYTDFVNLRNFELSDAVIMGGDNFYLFYSEPRYMSIRKKIFTQIAIESQNYNKVSKGNIAKGLLHVPLPPQLGAPRKFDSDGNEIYVPSEEEVISDELQQGANGIAVVFTRAENPIPFEFIKIEDDNETYLENYQKACEEAVLNVYRIPLARLMINTEKESMNSNKTQAIWEIYSLSLKQEQKKWKQLIKELIYAVYEIDVKVDMTTPDFSDNRETEVDLTITAWDSGALNLQQLIEALSEYIPIINLNDYDFTVNRDIWEYRKLSMDTLDPEALQEVEQIEALINEIG